MIDSFLRRGRIPIDKLPKQSLIPFTFCALFKITRELAHRYSRETYVDLVHELLSMYPQGGINGYILERSWLHLFS